MVKTIALIGFIFVVGLCSAEGFEELSRERRGVVEFNGSRNGSDDDPIIWSRNVEFEIRSSIKCDIDSVAINVLASYALSLGVSDIEKVNMVDKNGNLYATDECIKADLSAGYYNLTFDSDFAACSSSVQLEDEYVVVNYTLCVVPSLSASLITRDRNVFFYYSCHYDRDVVISLSSGTNSSDYISALAAGEEIFYSEGNGEDELGLTMDRFTDSSFNVTANDSLPVPIGTRVYFGVWLTTSDRFDVVLQGLNCYATPDINGSEVLNRFDIISDGCPAYDQTGLLDSNRVIQNFVGIHFEFSFVVFKWATEMLDEIYVHCTVNVCEGDPSCRIPVVEPCPTFGSDRRRRDVGDTARIQKTTFGPLSVGQPMQNIVIPEKHSEGPPPTITLLGDAEYIGENAVGKLHCNPIRLGCSHDCAVNGQNKFVCFCPSGLMLGVNGKTCTAFHFSDYSHSQFKKYKLSSNDVSVSIYDGLMLFAAVAAPLAALAYANCQ